MQLFRGTVRDNLTFFDASVADSHILDVVDTMGLSDWFAAMPEGLDTELQSGDGGLSAGEAQLLVFTRVFLKDPGLVILDEASSRLDPATETRIDRAVEHLLAERTGIIIAHRLTTVARADEIVILDDGRIAEHGVREASPRTRHRAFTACCRPACRSCRHETLAVGSAHYQLRAVVLCWQHGGDHHPLPRLPGTGTGQSRVLQFHHWRRTRPLRTVDDDSTHRCRWTRAHRWHDRHTGDECPLAYRIGALLQKNMLGHIFQLPGASALSGSAGESISRFRGDVDETRRFPLRVNDWIASIINGIISITIMMWIDPYITLICVLPILAVTGFVYVLRMRIAALRKAAREAAGHVTGYIGELFGAVQAVKVASAEVSMIEQFGILNRRRSQRALRDRLFDQLMESVFRNAVNISTAVIMILAAQKMRSGSFTVGDFSLFVYYLPGLAEMTWMFGSTFARFKQLGVSFDRMRMVMRGAADEDLVAHGPIYMNDDAPPVLQPPRLDEDWLERLEIRDLSFTHEDTGRGIEEISLSLERGSFTVVTGRIGSGKTTFLRALLGLLPKDGGEILWNGKSVDDPASFFVPPRSAYTPQVPWLYSAPLRDNLLMGLPEDGVDLHEAIRAAVLEEDLEALDEGLRTVVGPKGVRLSGGQMQRTAAARMFVRAPELLVFDDLSERS